MSESRMGKRSARQLGRSILLHIVIALLLIAWLILPASGTAAATGLQVALSVVPPGTTTPTVGSSITIQATVTYNGDPVPVAYATFAASGVNPSGGGLGNLVFIFNGIANWNYTGTNPGPDTVTAAVSYRGQVVTASLSINWGGVSSSPTITLTPDTQTLTADIDQATITAHVKDGSGNPVQSGTVLFNISGPNGGVPYIPAQSITNGEATLFYIGTEPGTDTITATYGSSTSAAAYVTWNPYLTLSVSPQHTSATLNSQVSLTATVRQSGIPLQGVEVSFTFTSGPNKAAHTSPFQQSTGANGQAVLTYTGSGGSGIDEITVSAPGTVSVDATVAWNTSGSEQTISLSPTSQNPQVNTRACITASVKDSAGYSLDGNYVKFSLSGNTNGGSYQLEPIFNGQARFCMVNPHSGLTSITATIVAPNGTQIGTDSATAQIAWGGPSGSSPQTITLSVNTDIQLVGRSVTLSATVRQNGLLVANQEVDFTISGPNSAESGTATTNAGGIATFSYTGTGFGRDRVSASIDGSTSNTVSVYWW